MVKNKNILIPLYLLCFYLCILFAPIEMLIKDSLACLLIKDVSKIVLIIYIYLEIKQITMISSNNKFKFIYLLPLLIAAISNYFFIDGVLKSINTLSFMISIFDLILSVIIEELIFRFIFLNVLINDYKMKDYKAIILSSLFFSLIHLFNIFTNDFVNVFAQIGYCLVLGLITGCFYLLSGKKWVPIAIHLIFNLLNQIIINFIFSIKIDIVYYVISVLISIFAIVYSLIIFFKQRRNTYVA